MSRLSKAVDSFVRSRYDNVLQERFSALEYRLQTALDRHACLLAAPLVQRVKQLDRLTSLTEAEFRVFSQFGEDGIIQYLIHHVPIEIDTFVEFGIEDYGESNTRFLLTNDNWRGLVIDGAGANIWKLKNPYGMQHLLVRHELTALHSFITAENINDLIRGAGVTGDIGLLSIDIDGNDYWVWKAIECIRPRIVVCEYNSVFGKRYPVTIPYAPAFEKTAAHYSALYCGASLPALCSLAEEKGYDFVGSNSAGNDAFFVRKDVSSALPRPSIDEGYVASRFRATADREGNPSYLSGHARAAAIEEMDVVNVHTGQRMKVRELS
jgi:hypothetical protein